MKKTKTKSHDIPKRLFVEAYKLVKANAGSAGVDKQSLEDFEKNLKDNLYKLWNRMSSGSYFPPPVKAVPIPKKSGGFRVLGIPAVSDRIAQMVTKLIFEPEVERHFLEDSYGYRPNKSALDAVGVTRKRCWHYDWVVEFDIKGLFDNIPHGQLMKAVRKHTQNKWVLLYIERWLKAPMQLGDNQLVERTRGTPQGGVISPVLSNLFLHYAFDRWMQRKHPTAPWCRYADDGLTHCKTKAQAEKLLRDLGKRFAECGLEMHPDKTKIVYCKDDNRKGCHKNTSFDFLGYTFMSRVVKNSKNGKLFRGFTPAVSKTSLNAMRERIRRCRWSTRSDLSLEDIAKQFNPTIQGWKNYYERYHPTAMKAVWRHLNQTLVRWAMKKFKRLRKRATRAVDLLNRIMHERPNLFAHWRTGMTCGFA